ncbi:MAG: histidine kinase N-terminal domain-containing protein [Actinomycetota bacterium]|nr:histidine kinase N-terminal domain-containing protein [Actinomycetota bacterium]
MATLAELARSHTDLDGPRVSHLQDLASTWGLLADLSFADLLLFGRGSGPASERFVLLGHVRPTTGTTLYRADLMGQVFDTRRRPLVGEAFATGTTVQGVVNVGADRDIRVTAVPVRHADEVVAVLVRERIRPDDRTASEQERTYVGVFDRFAAMIERGEFPYRDEERLRHRTPRVGDGLLLVDADGRVEFASPNAVSSLHRLGMTRGVTGARFGETGLGSAMLRSAFARRTAVIDELERTDDRSDLSLSMVSHCFPLLDHGVATGAIVLVRDVTELRRRDRQLVSRDTTIREIHHRVKNNLQTISSLLRLQARRLQGEEARSALSESVRRIGAISVVHETLAQSTDDDVAFTEIVRPLVRVVEESVSSPLRPLAFSVEGDAGTVPGQVTTTLAVVLTELLQNAVDHAFPAPAPDSGGGGDDEPESGSVRIELERRSDGLSVRVVDDGVGLPDGFDLVEATGLGLTLVRTFVEDELGGRISLAPVSRGRGTVAEVRVPASRLVGPWGDSRDPTG